MKGVDSNEIEQSVKMMLKNKADSD